MNYDGGAAGCDGHYSIQRAAIRDAAEISAHRRRRAMPASPRICAAPPAKCGNRQLKSEHSARHASEPPQRASSKAAFSAEQARSPAPHGSRTNGARLLADRARAGRRIPGTRTPDAFLLPRTVRANHIRTRHAIGLRVRALGQPVATAPNAMAEARPIPPLAPVTTAVRGPLTTSLRFG